MIDTLIERRSHGDQIAAAGVRVRLLLKGIDRDEYGPTSEDDPVIIAKLEQMMSDPDSMGADR